MKHLICISLLVLSTGWLLSACQSAPLPPGDPMQVTWGATVYRLQCARCHAPGHVAPMLTADRLIRYGNAHDLYAYIQQTMPLDKPSALPEQDYWDVTAYVLAHADMLLVPTLKPLGPDIADKVSFLPE